MFIELLSEKFTATYDNVKKVTIHIREGIFEILDNHQDLSAGMDNGVIEIQTNLKKYSYVIQQGVFVVCTTGIKLREKSEGTDIGVHAKIISLIPEDLSLDKIKETLKAKTLSLSILRDELILSQEQKQEEEHSNPGEAILFYIKVLNLEQEVQRLETMLIYKENLNYMS